MGRSEHTRQIKESQRICIAAVERPVMCLEGTDNRGDGNHSCAEERLLTEPVIGSQPR
jgi:hypothetical protein